MDDRKKRVRDYFLLNGMDYEGLDMEECCSNFIDEMEKGLTGKPCSLQMIPTYIDAEKQIPVNEPVIALDAGGTNFRVATIHFDVHLQPVIEKFNTFRMPGVEKKLDKQQFFQAIADYMQEVTGSGNKIGFCFSYPVEILPNRDGRLIRFTKEVQADGVAGELVGENLIEELRRRGVTGDLKLVLLNDTVATLLAGKSMSDRVFDGFIGFILGTGTNSCYIENNRAIEKVRGLEPEKNQIVNVESGGYGRARRGSIDLEFDATTADPGHFTFEKMISGAYFGALVLYTVREAAGDGLFSKGFAQVLKKIQTLDTSDISYFLQHPYDTATGPWSGICDEDDRVTLYYFIDQLIERAARLTAVNLSSVVIKSGRGTNPCAPLCITADGSMFFGFPSLRSRVECVMKSFLTEKKGLFYEFTHVDNGSLIGAAIAGLTNVQSQ
jgi:hexokinase